MTDAMAVEAASSGDDFARRARACLSFDLPVDLFSDGFVVRSPADLAVDGFPGLRLKSVKAAAVLVPVLNHRSEATVLLTRRVETLRAHSGQIAFPGGRIDPGDASPAAAALREAAEEIGLESRHVQPLGYLDPYVVGTGYVVIPTVALVTPPVRLALNPDEVDEAFEVPLAFLMASGNHRRESREIGGAMRSFYAMPYRGRHIWGATAGMLRNLYERLYGP